MSQRTALLVATALTVFVVIMIVGVVWQLFQKSTVETLGLQVAAPVASAQTTTEMVGETQAVTGPTQAQISEREAAFQQLVQQANQKLEQAYKQQQDLTKELAAEKKKAAPSAPAVVPQQPKYNVSAEQAAAIALNAEKGAVILKPAELISFQGAVAYEVTLDRGLVYIDANTGQVIYDSAAVIVIHDSGGGGGNAGGSPKASAPKSGGGHENEHENEKSHDNGSSHADSHSSEGEHGGD